MNVTVTYYVEVTSSWCYWAEPAWAQLKQACADRPVDFQWRIALLDASALPVSREQCEWFYRRSGLIMRSPFMLNSGWLETELKEYLAPNCLAEAAKDFGVTDDRVRLALAEAGLRHGQKIGRWDVSAPLAAAAADVTESTLLAKAKSADIEKRVRVATAEFHALQVTQRPAFVMENNIGDRAVFSGLAKLPPLLTAVNAMLDDAQAYAAHAAHFGGPPLTL